MSKSPSPTNASSSLYKELLIERRERILIVKFNRPKVRNALNRRAYYEIIRALKTATDDATITIVVFTGVGDVFSAGNDLNETATNIAAVRDLSENAIELEKKRLQLNRSANFTLRALARAFIYCPKILVALVNGLSVGIGFTLAALCDIVYCTENAYFEAPFTRLGLCPEMCSSYLFPQIFGHSKANETLIFGARMTAQEALNFAFVSHIFKTEELETKFWPKIYEYSVLPTESLQNSKRLVSQPRREVLLKTLSTEVAVLEKVRLGKVQIEAVEKYFKSQAKNKSKL